MVDELLKYSIKFSLIYVTHAYIVYHPMIFTVKIDISQYNDGLVATVKYLASSNWLCEPG